MAVKIAQNYKVGANYRYRLDFATTDQKEENTVLTVMRYTDEKKDGKPVAPSPMEIKLPLVELQYAETRTGDFIEFEDLEISYYFVGTNHGVSWKATKITRPTEATKK